MRNIVVTDQRHAPMFSEWMASRFDGEVKLDPATTRFIAHVQVDEHGNAVDILSMIALDHWTTHTCEGTVASNGSKQQKASRDFIFTVYDLIFNHFGKQRLNAHVAVSNERSLALMPVLGLREVARIEDHFGEDKDAILFGITKREWLAGPWASPSVNRPDTGVA